LKERSLSYAVKLKLMTTLLWSVAPYGCEAWTLTRNDKRVLKWLFTERCYVSAGMNTELVRQFFRKFKWNADSESDIEVLWPHISRAQSLCSYKDAFMIRDHAADPEEGELMTWKTRLDYHSQNTEDKHKTDTHGGNWWSRLYSLRPSEM